MLVDPVMRRGDNVGSDAVTSVFVTTSPTLSPRRMTGSRKLIQNFNIRAAIDKLLGKSFVTAFQMVKTINYGFAVSK